MKVGGLFSGIGGMELGLQRAGMKIAWMCEIDPYCRRVLAKHWPGVPIYEDVRELTANAIEKVDIISGGFPCQPWSVAGQRRGADDDRDLWPEMHRLVAELRPAWMLGENVAGLIGMGLDRVLSDLENEKYACRAFVVPACAVDAPHRRERVWIVAHAEQQGSQGRAWAGMSGARGASIEPSGICERSLGDAAGVRCNGHQALSGSSGSSPDKGRLHEPARAGQWSAAEWLRCEFDGKARRTQPGVRLLVDGLPGRVARLRALGNSVVPQVVEQIGRAIITAHNQISLGNLPPFSTANWRIPMADAPKKTRNVPQLSKDVRKLNALKARRAKVTELDDQITELEGKIAAQLGLTVPGAA